MIRRNSFLDFATWSGVGAIILFLLYALATSTTSSTDGVSRRLPVEPGTNVPIDEHLFEGYIVTSVLDGDSLIAEKGSHTIEVRIAGVDCPEFGQPYAEAAKRLTSQICLNQKADIKRLDIDRYDRYVSVVRIGSTNLAEHLLSTGMAWHFKVYDDSKRLAEIESLARQRRIGLWTQPHPVPPWEHRAKNRQQQPSGDR